MKKLLLTISILFLMVPMLFGEGLNFNTDINRSYIWRGTKFGGEPSISYGLSYELYNLSVGFEKFQTYGNNDEEYKEIDFDINYLKYLSDKTTLNFSVIYYYFPKSSYVVDQNMHYFEPNLTLSVNKYWNFFGGYMLGNNTNDLYLETKMGRRFLSFILGAGNGQYNPENGNFNVCNITFRSQPTLYSDDVVALYGLISATNNPRLHSWFWNFGLSFNLHV